MTTSDELRAAYLATRLSVEIDPDVWLAIERAAAMLPTPLHVLTAWNPRSEQLSLSDNLYRMDELSQALDEYVALWFPAVGQSPDGGWSEDMVAIVGMSRQDALELAQRFEQNAIFEVNDSDLLVLACDHSWVDQRELPALEEWPEPEPEPLPEPPAVEKAGQTREPEPDEERSGLSAAVSSIFGFEIETTLIRARYDGWAHDGPAGARCARCGTDLDLFGCTAGARNGQTNRLMAFVCTKCEDVKWPHEVDERTRECAKLRRKFALAVDEAAARKHQQTYHAYVIELSGEVDDREPDTDAEKPWVYVGQSSRTPEVRLQQHLEGYKSSRWVRRFGSHLRPDLYANHPPLPSQAASLAYEAWLAEALRLHGYPVKGGH